MNSVLVQFAGKAVMNGFEVHVDQDCFSITLWQIVDRQHLCVRQLITHHKIVEMGRDSDMLLVTSMATMNRDMEELVRVARHRVKK